MFIKSHGRDFDALWPLAAADLERAEKDPRLIPQATDTASREQAMAEFRPAWEREPLNS